MKQPSFHEELAAHLEGQQQPMPHPSQSYTIDPAVEAMRLADVRFKLLNDIRAPYIDPVKEARLKNLAADVDLQHARLREMGIPPHLIPGPGPITMHEPSHFSEMVMGAAVVLAVFAMGFVAGLLSWGAK